MGVGVDSTNSGADANVAAEAAVRARIQSLLGSAPLTSEYRAAVGVALALPGNALSATPKMRWARPVWTCCMVAGGPWQRAVPVAAAMELFMVALDLLDDEEDAEGNPVQVALGNARALNVSTGLLLLAQRDLAADGSADIIHAATLRACSGQHADLSPETEGGVTLGDALHVTAEKSSTLVAAAYRLGALMGGADARTQVLYEQLGAYVGMVAQLTNDMAALHPDACGKTDALLGRPTLPLTCAVILARPPNSGTRGREPHATRWTDGPLQLTWVVAETYRRYALDLISQLASDDTGKSALTTLLCAV